MYQQYMNEAQISIQSLSADELKELLNDDEKLDDRVIEAVSSLEAEKDEILEENRKMAEENLKKEPEIIELKGQINELADQGKELCKEIQEKLSEIKSKSGNMNQETALALLQTAAAESEEETENFVKKLLSNDLTIDAFTEQFLNIRKIMHLHKVKAEKMQELIRTSFTNSSITPSTGFFSNPNSMPYPSFGSVPYPLGPMSMPMPNFPRPF